MSNLHVVFEILDQETGKTIYVGKTSGNVTQQSLFDKIKKEKRYYQDLKVMLTAYEEQGKTLGVRFEYLPTNRKAFEYKKKLCEAYGFGKNCGTFKLGEPAKEQSESSTPPAAYLDDLPPMAIAEQTVKLPWQMAQTKTKDVAETVALPTGTGKTVINNVKAEEVKVKLDGPQPGYVPKPLDSEPPAVVKVEHYRYSGYWIMGNYYSTLGEASRATGMNYESLYTNVSNKVNGYEQALVPRNQR